MEEQKVEQPQTEEPKKKISVQLVRRDGKTSFLFEIDPRIEKMYRIQAEQGGETRESEKWQGLKFYYLPQLLKSQAYKEKLAIYNLIDDYGSEIVSNRHFNIAWLRTVGGKGEVILQDDNLSFAELSLFVKNALTFIKEYFDEYYRGFKIKGNVSVEI